MNHIVIRKANKVVDVFHGQDGWSQENWTRFYVEKNKLKFLKGSVISDDIMDYLRKQLFQE